MKINRSRCAVPKYYLKGLTFNDKKPKKKLTQSEYVFTQEQCRMQKGSEAEEKFNSLFLHKLRLKDITR